MKVSVDVYELKPRLMELSEALEPCLSPYARDGVAERALDLAEKNSKLLGKLAAFLVESGQLDLDEAVAMCEVGYSVELYVEPEPECQPKQVSPWLRPAPKGDSE